MKLARSRFVPASVTLIGREMIEMARPEMPGNESERAMEAEIARASDAAAVELAAAQAGETETAHRYTSRSSSAERDRLVQDARNIEFPVALRGYERAAVDRYVKDINRLITELEMSSSPESAVRRALEEVSEETRELLQRAHQTAEDITAAHGERPMIVSGRPSSKPSG